MLTSKIYDIITNNKNLSISKIRFLRENEDILNNLNIETISKLKKLISFEDNIIDKNIENKFFIYTLKNIINPSKYKKLNIDEFICYLEKEEIKEEIEKGKFSIELLNKKINDEINNLFFEKKNLIQEKKQYIYKNISELIDEIISINTDFYFPNIEPIINTSEIYIFIENLKASGGFIPKEIEFDLDKIIIKIDEIENKMKSIGLRIKFLNTLLNLIHKNIKDSLLIDIILSDKPNIIEKRIKNLNQNLIYLLLMIASEFDLSISTKKIIFDKLDLNDLKDPEKAKIIFLSFDEEQLKKLDLMKKIDNYYIYELLSDKQIDFLESINPFLQKKKEELINNMKCRNEEDPISLEAFNEMNIKELMKLINIYGYCYKVENIYLWIKELEKNNQEPYETNTRKIISYDQIKEINELYYKYY